MQYHYCRVCNRGHGIQVEKGESQNLILKAIERDPLSLGCTCTAMFKAEKARIDPERFTCPQKKVDGKWVDVPWEKALSEIGGKLKDIRKTKGGCKIALGLGTEPMNRSIDFVRSMGFAVSRGFGSWCVVVLVV